MFRQQFLCKTSPAPPMLDSLTIKQNPYLPYVHSYINTLVKMHDNLLFNLFYILDQEVSENSKNCVFINIWVGNLEYHKCQQLLVTWTNERQEEAECEEDRIVRAEAIGEDSGAQCCDYVLSGPSHPSQFRFKQPLISFCNSAGGRPVFLVLLVGSLGEMDNLKWLSSHV